jgi:hypothetical protein
MALKKRFTITVEYSASISAVHEFEIIANDRKEAESLALKEAENEDWTIDVNPYCESLSISNSAFVDNYYVLSCPVCDLTIVDSPTTLYDGKNLSVFCPRCHQYFELDVLDIPDRSLIYGLGA